jgi:hypothetical protein
MVLRRRRTANIRDGGRDGEAAINEADATEAAGNVGVAVIYQPEEAVAVNMPIRQPRRSARATSSPVRFPEGVA